MKKYFHSIFYLFLLLNSCSSNEVVQNNTAPKQDSGNKKWGAYGSKIILNGVYKGENLYVQNPFSDLGGFCVALKPVVNGNITTALIKSSAFEIKLTEYNFKIGDSVHIVITHDVGCLPKILNPEAIGLERDSFEVIPNRNFGFQLGTVYFN